MSETSIKFTCVCGATLETTHGGVHDRDFLLQFWAEQHRECSATWAKRPQPVIYQFPQGPEAPVGPAPAIIPRGGTGDPLPQDPVTICQSDWQNAHSHLLTLVDTRRYSGGTYTTLDLDELGNRLTNGERTPELYHSIMSTKV
jgi:hypothetical protein